MKVKTVKIHSSLPILIFFKWYKTKNIRESSFNYENIDFLENIHTAVRNFEPIKKQFLASDRETEWLQIPRVTSSKKIVTVDVNILQNHKASKYWRHTVPVVSHYEVLAATLWAMCKYLKSAVTNDEQLTSWWNRGSSSSSGAQGRAKNRRGGSWQTLFTPASQVKRLSDITGLNKHTGHMFITPRNTAAVHPAGLAARTASTRVTDT